MILNCSDQLLLGVLITPKDCIGDFSGRDGIGVWSTVMSSFNHSKIKFPMSYIFVC